MTGNVQRAQRWSQDCTTIAFSKGFIVPFSPVCPANGFAAGNINVERHWQRYVPVKKGRIKFLGVYVMDLMRCLAWEFQSTLNDKFICQVVEGKYLWAFHVHFYPPQIQFCMFRGNITWSTCLHIGIACLKLIQQSCIWIIPKRVYYQRIRTTILLSPL